MCKYVGTHFTFYDFVLISMSYKRLNIKRPIYKEFDNKEGLLYESTEHTFQVIKNSETTVINNHSLDIIENKKSNYYSI